MVLTSSDIEEVGRGSSVQVENVHGRHGESSAVDEAPDGSIELDKVEAKLGRLDLGLVLLGQVPQREDVLRRDCQSLNSRQGRWLRTC